MTPSLFWMIAALIAWAIVGVFFVIAMLPAIFELGRAIRRLKNKVARWLTGS